MDVSVLHTLLANWAHRHPVPLPNLADPAEAVRRIAHPKSVEMPDDVPGEADAALSFLRDFFDERVSFVSAYMASHFPDEYVLWRWGRLEPAIFQGFQKLGEVSPGYDFDFDRIGRRGMERYLEVNETLVEQGHHLKEGTEDQDGIQGLVASYVGRLAWMHLDRDDHVSRWIVASREDPPETDVWSANEHVSPGDLVFFYGVGGPSAISDVYEVTAGPHFRPISGWNGFWMEIEHQASIPNIPFGELKGDPVLEDWWIVQKHMQGVVTEPVPHRFYNRLIELMPDEAVRALELEREPVSERGTLGNYGTEEEFEDGVVEPLLQRLGFRWDRQKPVRLRIGSTRHTLAADFLVRDDQGPVTLVESKLQIQNRDQLAGARAQAKSYALQMGIPSCIVAAPEGLWVYEVVPGGVELVEDVEPGELGEREEALRETLLELRG